MYKKINFDTDNNMDKHIYRCQHKQNTDINIDINTAIGLSVNMHMLGGISINMDTQINLNINTTSTWTHKLT